MSARGTGSGPHGRGGREAAVALALAVLNTALGIPRLLFTAFEPSGDDHAAAVIAELRRRHPALPMYAWGGPKMALAGATVVERTGEDAVMGMPGLAKIREHQKINARIDSWLQQQWNQNRPISVHVPVDSPAANFPICRLTKARGLQVVHLVAPQVWAWGSWRVRKLRRLTDLVLCILPFEEGWFAVRGVPARFIGHPLFDEPVQGARLDAIAATFGVGQPRVALMPGSRPAEIENNFPLLLDAFRRLLKSFPSLRGVVAATKPAVEQRVREMASKSPIGWPTQLITVAGQTDAVIRWCDLALVVSGTVTLQIAKQERPMVALYRLDHFSNVVSRLVVSTPHLTLPNLIAGRRVVPEFIAPLNDGGRIAAEAERLLSGPGMAQQRADLHEVAGRFAGFHAAQRAADAIEEVAGITPATVLAPGPEPLPATP